MPNFIDRLTMIVKCDLDIDSLINDRKSLKGVKSPNLIIGHTDSEPLSLITLHFDDSRHTLVLPLLGSPAKRSSIVLDG